MISRQSIPYIIVSALCLGLHNVVLIVGDYFLLPLWVSLLLSFIIVASFGYICHSVATFRQPLHWIGFGRYALAMTSNLPIAYVILWVLTKVIGLSMIWAAPASSILMVGVNFLLSRWAIFRPNHKGALS